LHLAEDGLEFRLDIAPNQPHDWLSSDVQNRLNRPVRMQDRHPPTFDGEARFVAVARRTSPTITISIDGESIDVPKGQSILTSVLTHQSALRIQMASGLPRAGFCLMGACQECWIWLSDGQRVRACTTPVTDGMEICTSAPAGFPRP